MTKIMDGKALAAKLRAELKEKVAALKEGGKEIGLAVVLIGDDQASKVYVRNKIKGCEEVGIRSYSFNLPASASQRDAENLVKELVASDNIHGILVQLPLPSHLDEQAILKLIPPAKDVDGFCAQNVGNLAMNRETIVACTPFGVMKLLEEYGVDPRGKNAVVLGRSNIVGKPMAMLLLNADATVTVCHSKTKNLKEVCAGADILVVAIGRAKFVTADMVKEGAVVVDVGMDRDENGKLCGDVDFESVKDKVSMITPVPGGVGPMTITMLLYNTYITAMRG
ncbi:bifunctional methylenetetrahydrofolate dehydrogenase/methenyltetrahydrofolate cyclohydrolase FolD [Candidatus Borkfalkia ceftriaxoniphila]|uniref:Bifunctional protein FolD n=1 Tax=Candidatus Borkfalkia ceftriaxoniphila TaxID=2508949 RepID=A0A4Q2K8E3_9FIRM|nr:bifunctional methylenetetrahydrofolate dehydrogenase/methenyltetrahydrofolate cyclohydrolase FolD [Candidatus Borkfalkia ceftriaxoniphila]RXZ58174.1 bifunctional methylenetetrahydrofolate dehydrogenase/methenyltetrahydrofolate cyclohydrolase FolD [Candidatus Borkfalkia ceftriaxoniphila]